MKRTYWYASMTKDEVQHSRMTFYEAVKFVLTITGISPKYLTVWRKGSEAFKSVFSARPFEPSPPNSMAD